MLITLSLSFCIIIISSTVTIIHLHPSVHTTVDKAGHSLSFLPSSCSSLCHCLLHHHFIHCHSHHFGFIIHLHPSVQTTINKAGHSLAFHPSSCSSLCHCLFASSSFHPLSSSFIFILLCKPSLIRLGTAYHFIHHHAHHFAIVFLTSFHPLYVIIHPQHSVQPTIVKAVHSLPFHPSFSSRCHCHCQYLQMSLLHCLT